MTPAAAPLILLVEDNPLNRKLTADWMTSHGYNVLVAADGAEAEQIARQRAPRLVLMDVGLPDIDGLALTRKLKADPATAGLRIVVLSAFAMADDEARAYAAGCDGYITKPIDLRTFLKTIDPFLS